MQAAESILDVIQVHSRPRTEVQGFKILDAQTASTPKPKDLIAKVVSYSRRKARSKKQ